MPNFAISASSVPNSILSRFYNQEEIMQSLSGLYIKLSNLLHIAVSTISKQFAIAATSGDKTPSQEYPMYNREQPESARASQEETSGQKYSAENHGKFVITSYLMPWSKNACLSTTYCSHISVDKFEETSLALISNVEDMRLGFRIISWKSFSFCNISKCSDMGGGWVNKVFYSPPLAEFFLDHTLKW